MPIRWRLTVYNALSIGLILVVLGLVAFLLLREAAFNEVEESVRGRALAAARTVESLGELPGGEAERVSLGDEFVVVRDGRGRILDPSGLGSVPEGQMDDPVWRRALETGRPVGGEADYSEGATDYVYAVPVEPREGGARIVEAGRSYESVAGPLGASAALLAAAILGAVAVSVGGAYFLARTALAPVEAVARSARRIGAGDLSRRLPVARPGDEIGYLTTTINDLLARLEAAFARREEAFARQRRFAADASHELKTPLTNIIGYAQMLRDWGVKEPKTAEKGVARILSESERMRGLVEDLLLLARGDDAGQQTNPTPADLGTLAAEAVDAARAAAAGKVVIEYLPPKQPVGLYFDVAQIRRAVDVLLDNAVKYTPEGGVVIVRVGREDGWARLEVSDTGVGIAAEDLPRVFERFYRADPARSEGGSGLGLSIARQTARAHGGDVTVTSKAGKGSTFVLTFPEAGPAD